MSIKGDFGFEPMNKASIRGAVTGVDDRCRRCATGEYVEFSVSVPRLNGKTDQIMCVAFEPDAEEICDTVKTGDVIFVEGSIRVDAKGRRVWVIADVWYLEDGDVPSDQGEREEELRRLEDERVRRAMAIGGALPPEDMTAWENGAWVCAQFHGGDWERRWFVDHGVEASTDGRIARVYEILKTIFKPKGENV